MTRRERVLMLTAALLAAAAAAGEAWRRRRADPAPAQARLAGLSNRWRAERSERARDLGRTYAVVAAGSRNALWSELLQSAGVPSPLEVIAVGGVPEGARLVVCDGAPCGDVAERATLAVVRGPGRPARELRWGELVVPLAGFEVTPLSLEEGERSVATDETGSVIAALKSSGGAARLRLGVDLASALWRLRYGTPENVNRDLDHNGEVQPADLAPIVRGEAIMRPFADELLASILDELDRALPCPLPRTRGLPEGVRSLLVITSDQDFASDETVLAMAEALSLRGVRATFMVTDPSVGLPADINVSEGRAPRLALPTAHALLALGHDLGAHPFPRDIGDVTRHLEAQSQRLGAWPVATRNHHLRWFGFVDIPRTEARYGVALNFDAMPISDGSLPSAGFSGGAAQPVMFVDERGERVQILHQTTSVDDFYLRVPDYSRLAGAAARLSDAARRVVAAARSAEVPVVLNAHPVLYRFAPQWLHAVLDLPDLRAVSASDWLTFVLDRRASRIPAARCGRSVAAALRPGVVLHEARPRRR
jgi:hypothetical protein